MFYQGKDAVLSFETDTLRFDTVFTEMATITRFFKVHNNSNATVMLNEIKLKNLSGLNTFRMNVDGTPGTTASNVEIPANDYIYIFVEATVNPTVQSNPFVIVDEISYSYNNTEQTSYLSAWGQNAHYHKGEVYRNEVVTWQNDLPHIVLNGNGFPGVGVDSFATLNIMPGCKIYVGQGAGLFVDGKLNVGLLGNQDSVVFRSSSIETLQNGTDLENNPGLWQGIAMFSGSVLKMYNTCINQAIWGLQARHYSETIYQMLDDAGRPDILLDKVQIKNSALNALIAINANIVVTNSMFYHSGAQTVAIGLGGNIQFDNCTIYNSGIAGSDEKEALILSNIAQTATGTGVHPLDMAAFTNCIFYGNANEKLSFNKDNQAAFNYAFKNCLIKTEDATNPFFENCIINQNPNFENTSDDNFHLKSNSPCIAAGFNNGLTEDIYFSPRTNNDIGAIAY